jgi:hypothetical protein
MNAMLMNLPFSLPDWLPGWVFLLLALPVLLYLLAFLLMPFSVFGVKARIESLEAQIDSLHEDLRLMSMRAAGVLQPSAKDFERYDDVPNFGRLKNSQRGYAEPAAPAPVAAPVPRAAPVPAPAPRAAPVPTPMASRERLVPPPLPPRPARRTEPRLD